MPHILILNGSVRGPEGNSAALAKFALDYLTTQLQVSASILTLSEPMPRIHDVYKILEGCDGFLIISGVYWNNYGSPLQRFIEVMTAFENSPAFFGKPVACAVSMDSVGGIEVAGRIHAVFCGLGCWSPPCSTIVLSRVGQEAIAASADNENDPNDDVWRLDDIKIVLKNLVIATGLKKEAWECWPHIKTKIPDGDWPEAGALDVDTPRFL